MVHVCQEMKQGRQVVWCEKNCLRVVKSIHKYKQIYICIYIYVKSSFPGGSIIKNPLAVQETQETRVQSLGWEDPLEKEMATHSSILVWEIPWTEKSGGLQSLGLQMTERLSMHTYSKLLRQGGIRLQKILNARVKNFNLMNKALRNHVNKHL